MTKLMMIGDLGRMTGIKLNTIRFYEQVGLLPEPARTTSGRRTYGEKDVKRLVFIRHARKLGFGTAMIRSLLDLAAQPERRCASAREIALKHLSEVETRICSLVVLKTELERIVADCAGDRLAADCGILEALGGAEMIISL